MSQPQLAAVDLWSSLLQLLQRLPVQSAAQRESIHDSISDTVNKLCHAPALALPAWADLVDHLKVPQQLGTVCCKLQEAAYSNSSSTSSSSGSSSSRGAEPECDISWALHSMALSLECVEEELLEPEAAAGSAQGLIRSVCSQLQESGFLAKLPGLMLTTAKQLQDRVEAAKLAAAGTGFESSASTTSDSSQGGTTQSHTVLAPDKTLSNTCNALLECCEMLQWLQAQHPDLLPPMAASSDAALALCFAVLQHESVRLANLPEGATPYDPHQLWPVSQLAVTTMSSQAHYWSDCTKEPNAAECLNHPNVKSAPTLLAFAAFCASHTQADIIPSTTTTTTSSSSSSSGSGSASSSDSAVDAADEQQACRAWDAAKQQQQQFHAALAEHLEPTGVTLSAVAWAVVNSSRSDLQSPQDLLDRAVQAAYALMTSSTNADHQSLQQQHLLQDPEFAAQAAAAAQSKLNQFLLLAELVLKSVCAMQQQQQQQQQQAATSTDGSSDGFDDDNSSDYIECLFTTVWVSRKAVKYASMADAWHKVSAALAAADAAVGDPATAAGAAVRMAKAAAAAAVAKATRDTGSNIRYSAGVAATVLTWFDEMLHPTFVQLISSLAQCLREQQVAQPSDAAAAPGGSSGSGGSSSSSSSSSTNWGGETAISLVEILSDMAGCTLHSCPADHRPQQPPSVDTTGASELGVQRTQRSWQTHACAVCTALESLLRALAAPSIVSTSNEIAHWIPGACQPTVFRLLQRVAVAAGRSSPEADALFSLMCTSYKVALAVKHLSPPWWLLIAHTAVSSVKGASPPGQTASGSAAAVAAADADVRAAGPLPTLSGSAAAAAATTAAADLRWLALLGRCFTFCAQVMADTQQQSPQAEFMSVLLGLESSPELPTPAGPLVDIYRPLVNCKELKLTQGKYVTSCWEFLGDSGRQTGLAAAGYPVSGIVGKLQQLIDEFDALGAACGEGMGANADDAAAVAAYGRIVQQLHAVGLTLNTLAFPQACNNPSCTTFAGDTETETVTGPSSMCGGCKVAHYCSRACQKQHWKQHKPVCTALAAATAAALAAAGASGSGATA